MLFYTTEQDTSRVETHTNKWQEQSKHWCILLTLSMHTKATTGSKSNYKKREREAFKNLKKICSY